MYLAEGSWGLALHYYCNANTNVVPPTQENHQREPLWNGQQSPFAEKLTKEFLVEKRGGTPQVLKSSRLLSVWGVVGRFAFPAHRKGRLEPPPKLKVKNQAPVSYQDTIKGAGECVGCRPGGWE